MKGDADGAIEALVNAGLIESAISQAVIDEAQDAVYARRYVESC